MKKQVAYSDFFRVMVDIFMLYLKERFKSQVLMVILFQTCQILKNSTITTTQRKQVLTTVLQFTITTRSLNLSPRLRQVFRGSFMQFFTMGEEEPPLRARFP